jgi:hypothetical protein
VKIDELLMRTGAERAKKRLNGKQYKGLIFKIDSVLKKDEDEENDLISKIRDPFA